MDYKLIVSPRAQKEIENAIDYYALYSANAPEAFIHKLKEAYALLQTHPFFAFQYKNVRALKLRRFPYDLFFTVDEDKKIVKLLSCFHSKRQPNQRPIS
jgi:toxin ParE1/3/4